MLKHNLFTVSTFLDTDSLTLGQEVLMQLLFHYRIASFKCNMVL